MRSKGDSQGSKMGAVLPGDTEQDRDRDTERPRGAGRREEPKRKRGLAECHGMGWTKQGSPAHAQVSPGGEARRAGSGEGSWAWTPAHPHRCRVVTH